MAVAADFIARTSAETIAGPSAHLAIVETGSDRAIGSISRHGPVEHRAMIGYWLAPAARGRGLASRAVRIIAGWSLETTEVIRLEIFTEPDNEASGAVATRSGFEFEGMRRAWLLDRDGHPLDCPFYVMVRPGA